jgi:hypothetical protein
MHPHPRAAIERGCSIGANHAQNRQLTRSDLKTRAAIARFRIMRAGFNKRATRAFPKADHRLDIRNGPLPDSNIDEMCCVCPGATA